MRLLLRRSTVPCKRVGCWDQNVGELASCSPTPSLGLHNHEKGVGWIGFDGSSRFDWLSRGAGIPRLPLPTRVLLVVRKSVSSARYSSDRRTVTVVSMAWPRGPTSGAQSARAKVPRPQPCDAAQVTLQVRAHALAGDGSRNVWLRRTAELRHAGGSV